MIYPSSSCSKHTPSLTQPGCRRDAQIFPERGCQASASRQAKIVGSGRMYYPLLKKSAIAIGKHLHIPGSYWESCPAGDKEKIFKCLIVEFIAVHDFGSFKSNGYKVCERALCARRP